MCTPNISLNLFFSKNGLKKKTFRTNVYINFYLIFSRRFSCRNISVPFLIIIHYKKTCGGNKNRHGCFCRYICSDGPWVQKVLFAMLTDCAPNWRLKTNWF